MVVRFQKFKLQINQYKEANKYQALTKNVNFVTKCFSDYLGHILYYSALLNMYANSLFLLLSNRLVITL